MRADISSEVVYFVAVLHCSESILALKQQVFFMKKLTTEQKKNEFTKDLEARRSWHRKMNYHYLMYKGIDLLNQRYTRDKLESIGMQIWVPRTFMTIESIRPDLDKPIDIRAKHHNNLERDKAEKTSLMLKGEWQRSHADKEKAKAEFDALIYGSGYLLSQYHNEEVEADYFSGYDKDGKPEYKKGKETPYEGMRAVWVDPYYMIPDRMAKTYEHGKHTSPRRQWIISVWDFETFKEYAENKGWKTEGLEKGGQIEELDSIRKQIDAIYHLALRDTTVQSDGSMVTGHNAENNANNENLIGVITEYTANEVNVYAGNNWTACFEGSNPFPKKEIPIYTLKDYDVPGELEGIGECEVIRWQQYEENKIHNLSYLQVLFNTFKRYGVIEGMLEDPTEFRLSNITKPIRVKYLQGMGDVNKAIQPLNQHSSNDYPQNFLQEVKGIGQMATGQTDYNIGASESRTDTLGEANLMTQAGNKRIRQKIKKMEEEGLVPLLENWASAIPQLYTEELDYLLNDESNKSVKFIPYSRDMNNNATVVAEYAVKTGIMKGKTIEEIFIAAGYSDVVFVSDLVGNLDLTIKTSLAYLDRNEMVQQYQLAIVQAREDNLQRMQMGMPPKWDTSKLTEELLRQFSDIIEDINEYQLEQPAMQTAPQVDLPTQGQMEQTQPTSESLINSESLI